MTQRPADFGLSAPRLRVAGGDISDLEAVGEAIRGTEAVICNEKGVADEPYLYRFAFAGLFGLINKTIYDDMRRMEKLLRESEMDWTIVRPAGLYAADRVTAYRSPTYHQPGVSTSTADLADALIREAFERRNARETIQVLSDDGKPPYLLLLARQAGLHRR